MQNCGKISRNDENFTVIALNLDEGKETVNLEIDPNQENYWSEKSDSIEDLMDKYNAKEELRSMLKVDIVKN